MNSISIYGRLARDPSLKNYTNKDGDSGSLCNFTVAVNRPFGEEADFFNCTIFGKRAEVIDKFFHKGSRIAINGSMQCEKKDDKYYWKLIARDFDFVDSKSENQGNQAETAAPADSFETIDDDVPF